MCHNESWLKRVFSRFPNLAKHSFFWMCLKLLRSYFPRKTSRESRSRRLYGRNKGLEGEVNSKFELMTESYSLKNPENSVRDLLYFGTVGNHFLKNVGRVQYFQIVDIWLVLTNGSWLLGDILKYCRPTVISIIRTGPLFLIHFLEYF